MVKNRTFDMETFLKINFGKIFYNILFCSKITSIKLKIDFLLKIEILLNFCNSPFVYNSWWFFFWRVRIRIFHFNRVIILNSFFIRRRFFLRRAHVSRLISKKLRLRVWRARPVAIKNVCVTNNGF